MVLTMGSTI